MQQYFKTSQYKIYKTLKYFNMKCYFQKKGLLKIILKFLEETPELSLKNVLPGQAKMKKQEKGVSGQRE